MEKKTVKMRGSNTSVLVEGEGGKISTLYFEEDDDDDEDDDESEDEVEDFDDDNALSFQVESLQEVDESGKHVLRVCLCFVSFCFCFFPFHFFHFEPLVNTLGELLKTTSLVAWVKYIISYLFIYLIVSGRYPENPAI